MRSLLRSAVIGLLVGAVALGSAWAGASLTVPRDVALSPSAAADAPGAGALAGGERLSGGWFRAGTAVRSLVPPASKWKQGSQCSGAPEQLYTPVTPEGCLITFDMKWANGVDSQNPIEVRALAIGNGKNAVVLAIMDVVGYMASYPVDAVAGCTDCGIAQITTALSGELGIPATSMVIASSHTHAAPSTIADGPAWYYEHIRDQVKAAVREAVAAASAGPAIQIETGSAPAKAFNTDRRLVDRAVPDYEMAWLRGFVPGPGVSADETMFTLGNFAVHPTVRTENSQLHSGLAGPFARRLEQQLGGRGFLFPGGLGDQKVDRGYGVNGLGIGMADVVVNDVARGGYVLQSNDVAVARTEVQIPVENQFFTAALAAGYAVRDFTPPFGGGPVAVTVQKGGANMSSCQSAAALHVVGPVSAIRLGDKPPAGKVDKGPEYRVPVQADNVVLVQAPGEIFASISGTVKDYLSRSSNVLVMAMANDTLGYMIPANQYDMFASQGLGIANNAIGLANYEEALSLGRCTGDIVMKAMLQMGAQVGAMGEGEGA